MKYLLKSFIFFITLLLLTNCSSITDNLDVSSIINKAESWFFEEEEMKDEDPTENLDEASNQTNLDNEEEIFPDINNIPQKRPEFEEIDEQFFSANENTSEEPNDIIKDNIEDSSKSSDNIETEASTKNKNILAILYIRDNIRFKLVKLLSESDPPVDIKQEIMIPEEKSVLGEKIAIIQFPNNSILPDETADAVLVEIVKIKNRKNIRLVGHSSKLGSDTIEGKRRNMEISISRAETIKTMLVNKGYEANKIEVLGKGDLEPLKDDTEKYGEAINRRVEIFFISD